MSCHFEAGSAASFLWRRAPSDVQQSLVEYQAVLAFQTNVQPPRHDGTQFSGSAAVVELYLLLQHRLHLPELVLA